MPKFATKPSVVDAVRWFPPGDPRHNPFATPVVDPAPPDRKLGDIMGHAHLPGKFRIRRTEADTHCPLEPGDWIVRHADGLIEVTESGRFLARYEPLTFAEEVAAVTEETAPQAPITVPASEEDDPEDTDLAPTTPEDPPSPAE